MALIAYKQDGNIKKKNSMIEDQKNLDARDDFTSQLSRYSQS